MARDWPHDPDGEEGSEGRRKYGHAVLAKKLDEADDFPLEARSFLDDYGDHPVRIDHDTVVSVEEIFDHVDVETFEDMLAFHRAVGDALRRSTLWTYNPTADESGTAP